MDKYIRTGDKTGMLYRDIPPRIWKIEEIGDCSLILSSTAYYLNIKKTYILSNPTDSFIEEHGKHNYYDFNIKYGAKIKELLHTPETLVVYFENKTPSWAKVGGEVIF